MPHCHQCDYDLTGATAGCCPECGAVIDYYRIDRKAARRRQDRAAVRMALIALFPLAASVALRLTEGRFTLISLGLLLAGVGWLAFIVITWVIEGIESH